MSDNICAPKKYDSKNNTCFTLNELVELVGAYNRHLTKTMFGPNNEIGGSDNKNETISLIKIKKNKAYLLKELLKRFNNVCGNDESCITKQDFMNEIVKEMREDFDKKIFRSIGPVKSTEWLSNDDIDNILSQYENVYPDFKFLGAVPSNCSDLSFCQLFKLDYNKFLKDNINQLAIVFNLDVYGQPGSHWVALYINIKNGEIYFCDSNGHEPIENIQKVIDVFIKYYTKKFEHVPIYKHNPNSYQTDNSECGIYSCNFIIRKLAGEKFDAIINNALTFKEINACRNIYFRNKPSKYKPNNKCDPQKNNS